MPAGEIAFRLRQEVDKRVDAAIGTRVDYLAPRGAPRHAHEPHFFFNASARADILETLRAKFPQQAQSIVDYADRCCRHRFDLLGYSDLDYGTRIDWHCDKVHGKVAPRLPFYKIKYLEFDQVGDVKVTWELNRHQHFVTLAKAYGLTGDERYVAELFAQWRGWHADNPYPIGVNWSSSLEVALRSLSWLWVYFLLDGTPVMSDEIRGRCLKALALNARHIERYLSTYFSPNSHLIGEGLALFFIGTFLHGTRSARRWRDLGWDIVVREAVQQVRDDGMHFEQSLYYHVYHVDFLLHAAIFAERNGFTVPSKFNATLRNALDALCLLARFGPPPKFGDEDGGRLFDPHRNRAQHMTDPLSTGAVLFSRGDFKFAAGTLCEETLWLLGAGALDRWTEITASAPSSASSSLTAAGIYCLSDDADSEVIVDAGPAGALHGGHGHADALSVCMRRRGIDLIIDPGTAEYTDSFGRRAAFRGTAMHNTLQIDERDQMESTGLFKWARLPASRAEIWVRGDGFDLFCGSHDGYSALEPPVTHKRWIFSAKCGFWLVRDVAEGEGARRLDLHWHLGPLLQRQNQEQLRFVAPDGSGLSIVLPRETGVAPLVRNGSWSPYYGRIDTALVVQYGATKSLPAEYCAVLVSLPNSCEDPGTVTLLPEAQEGAVSAYRFTGPRGDFTVFFADGRPWRLGDCASDAQFLCRLILPDGQSRVMSYGGTWAQIGNQALRIG
jgi:hypothetical protein